MKLKSQRKQKDALSDPWLTSPLPVALVVNPQINQNHLLSEIANGRQAILTYTTKSNFTLNTVKYSPPNLKCQWLSRLSQTWSRCPASSSTSTLMSRSNPSPQQRIKSPKVWWRSARRNIHHLQRKSRLGSRGLRRHLNTWNRNSKSELSNDN